MKKLILVGLFLVVMSFIVFSDGVQLSDRHDTSNTDTSRATFLVKATEHENCNLGDFQYTISTVIDPEPLFEYGLNPGYQPMHALFEVGANVGANPKVTRIYAVDANYNNQTKEFYINDIKCAEYRANNTGTIYLEYSQECVDSIRVGSNEFYMLLYPLGNDIEPLAQYGATDGSDHLMDSLPVIVGTHYI